MSNQPKEKKTKVKVYPETLQPHFNVQIPVEVLLHQDLDTYSVVVFAYMKLRFQYFQNINKPYCESNNTIASAVGLSRSKVIESINKLESLGFLVREVRNRLGIDKKEQTNIYTVVDCLAESNPVFTVKKIEKTKTQTKVFPVEFPDYGDEPF